MQEWRIVVTPYAFVELLECSIHKKVNEHATAVVSGYIAEEDTQKYVEECGVAQNICIQAFDEEGHSQILFNGMVTNLKLYAVNGLKKLSVEAVSYSFLLDVNEHVRTFQNPNQTYRAVTDVVGAAGNATLIYTVGKTEKTNSVVVQYKETDWEFFKRLASWLNTVIVPDYMNAVPCVCFGMPQKSEKYEVKSGFYNIEKSIDELLMKKENLVKGLQEQDAISHVIETRDVFDLCSPVSYQGQTLYVYEIETVLQKGELLHRYSMRTMNGFKTQKQYNERLIGTSLSGKITGVSRDTVRVNITEDENDDQGVKWFPYSTVYSSPDGTGWYCMPENGDAIRLYFPNEKENEAFVMSSVHKGGHPARSNPEVKSLSTKYGKEVVFNPGSIVITNHNGMSITMDDKEGITIESDKDVQIKSEQNIVMNAVSSLNLEGQQGVLIKQNSNEMNIKDIITLKAEKIEHQ